MRTNYRELARLKRKEVSNRQIAVIMNVSSNIVNRIIRQTVESGRGWSEIETLSDHELITIFESSPAVNPLNYVQPDYAKLSKELISPSVTMQLFWEEYHVYHLRCKCQSLFSQVR